MPYRHRLIIISDIILTMNRWLDGLRKSSFFGGNQWKFSDSEDLLNTALRALGHPNIRLDSSEKILYETIEATIAYGYLSLAEVHAGILKAHNIIQELDTQRTYDEFGGDDLL